MNKNFAKFVNDIWIIWLRLKQKPNIKSMKVISVRFILMLWRVNHTFSHFYGRKAVREDLQETETLCLCVRVFECAREREKSVKLKVLNYTRNATPSKTQISIWEAALVTWCHCKCCFIHILIESSGVSTFVIATDVYSTSFLQSKLLRAKHNRTKPNRTEPIFRHWLIYRRFPFGIIVNSIIHNIRANIILTINTKAYIRSNSTNTKNADIHSLMWKCADGDTFSY